MKEGAQRNRTVLVRITLLFAVLTAASVALEAIATVGLPLSLGASVLLGAAYSGMIAALICLPGKVGSGGQLWSLVRPVLSRLIWASLLVAIGVAAGLVLLIVPGLILLTIWSVVVPVIVAEKVPVTESLSRSRELVRGNGLRVFGFLILLGVVSAIFLLLAYLITSPLGTGILYSVVFQFLVTSVVNPITSIGPASLYNQINSKPPGTVPAAEDQD